MRLSPLDPSIPTHDVAVGADYHADEADSAFEMISGMLDASDREGIRELAQLGRATKKNPKSDEDKFPRDYLYPIAFLVTGQWGPPKRELRYESVVPASRLARRKNPREWYGDVPFFDRMRKLVDATDFAMEYATRKSLSGWISMLEKIKKAVAFILSQKKAAKSGNGDIRSFGTGKKKGDAYSILGVSFESVASKGNQKLPFVTYSELPMATCPGASACAVYEEQPQGKKGWCYSFRAWRMPEPFARQFFCTLANTADREFTIMAAALARGMSPDVPMSNRALRAELAIEGRERRFWPQFVKVQAFRVLQKTLIQGSKGFLRLFVDGDIDHEDCIVEWMEVCRDIGTGGSDVLELARSVEAAIKKSSASKGGGKLANAVAYLEASGSLESLPGAEVYGYSKCWQQFVNVDDWYRANQVAWPSNYTLNLSSGSIYAGNASAAVRDRMLSLPITRGYFEAIPLDSFVKNLKGVYDKRTGSLVKSLNPIGPKSLPFDFSEERVRVFAAINAELEDVAPSGGFASREEASAEVARLASVANEILRQAGSWDGTGDAPIESAMKSKQVFKLKFLKDVVGFYAASGIVMASEKKVAEGLVNAQREKDKKSVSSSDEDDSEAHEETPRDPVEALRINYAYTVQMIRKKTFEVYFNGLMRPSVGKDGSIQFSEGVRRQFMLDYAGGQWDSTAEDRFIKAWSAEAREKFVMAIADVTPAENNSTLGALISIAKGRIEEIKRVVKQAKKSNSDDVVNQSLAQIDELESTVGELMQRAKAKASEAKKSMKSSPPTASQLHSIKAHAMTEEALRKKAIAWGLHEVFMALSDTDGSCPLVCGNCSDASDPTDPGVHRCASKTAFKGKNINIGIH